MAWKKRNTSGPSAAPPVDALRSRDIPRRSFKARKSNSQAIQYAARQSAEGFRRLERISDDRYPIGISRWYMKRLNGEVSMIFTCTVEVRFSQKRGGPKRMCGPISRMFSALVSGSSGKLTVKPKESAVATDII